MRNIRHIVVVVFVVFLAACSASTNSIKPGIVNDESFDIIGVLPKEIAGFLYKGTKSYPDPWGYSLRYQFGRNQAVYSDVYIYPVPKEAEGYGYKEVIIGMTKQALKEIDLATKQGHYSEYKIIESSEFELNGRFTSRTDVYLVKSNLISYSLLFLTESKGKLIKARITMPDNNSNRNNPGWEIFVEKIFTSIIDNIEKT